MPVQRRIPDIRGLLRDHAMPTVAVVAALATCILVPPDAAYAGYVDGDTLMRIAGVLVGVKLTGSGNLMQNLHPLYAYRPALTPYYSNSIGFQDMSGNIYRCCYSDHFSTGFVLNGRSVLESCIVWWYGKPEHGKGQRRTAIVCPHAFTSHVTDLTIGFKGSLARNTVLEVAKDGGKGFLLNPMLDERLVNEPRKAYLKYMQGGVAREKEKGAVVTAEAEVAHKSADEMVEDAEAAVAAALDEKPAEKPKAKRTRKKAEPKAEEPAADAAAEAAEAPAEEAPKPKKRSTKKKAAEAEASAEAPAE